LKKLGRFHTLFLVLNSVAVLMLLCSYLGGYLSPQKFWPIAFFPLLYPYLIIINISFIIFWLVQFRLLFLLSFIAILVGYTNLKKLFQFGNERLTKPVVESGAYIKVMSFNVRVFDLYNWKNNKNTRNKILEFIKTENPDIINFQEFFTDEGKTFLHEDTLKSLLHLPFANIVYTASHHKNEHWGIATYSRFPIVGKDVVTFNKKSNNRCIYSDIKINDKIVRVYNLHLQSLHFKRTEYKMLDDLKKKEEVEFDAEEVSASRMILARLKRAFVKRASQADSVAASVARSPHDVIVCGDFNDSPFSYAYKTISSNLKDAFVESGNGFGPTYNGNLPPLRIDFILYSDNLKGYNFQTSKVDLSDHFPVSCYFKIPSKN
jgi:endonuclease/exonuclease/phosphatase family metal-dependent hydrolase